MLANGATLEFKEKSKTSDAFKKLLGLKEIPELGVEAEKVENSPIDATHKMYEMGVGDLPDMVYKFSYDNTKTDSPYRIMRDFAAAGTLLTFKETLKDGSITQYDAQVSVKRTGGALNGVLEFELTMAVQSDFEYTDPA